MNFEHSLFVPLPVERAWPLFLDIERIAPCVPGAQLQGSEGNEYRGSVKVRLGPITAQYKGAVTIDEADEAARRIVLTAKARDVHGQGNAQAAVVARMTPEDAGTRIALLTDLQISGKVAQLGKGVMQDVSAKLVQQFAQALEREIASEPSSAAAPPAAEPREAEAVDLLALAGSALGKRLAMGAAVALLALVAFGLGRKTQK